MDKQLEKTVREMTSRSYWLGVAVGLLASLILGGFLGYKLSSDNIIILPVNQDIKT